jgi:LETM1 and EF-hand domain-containing protein 1, mitochondrial
LCVANSRLALATSSRSYRSPSTLSTRSHPPYVQALAILLPRRGYATETSTLGGDSGPPPGFNLNEAKKPLPKDVSKKASKSPSLAELQKSDEKLHTPQTSATAVDKSIARDNASLTDLAAEKAAATAKGDEKQLVAGQKEEKKKLTIGQKIKKELSHYWDGTKLLATEVKISSKLALKMAAGYELSRRETRQVCLGRSFSPQIHTNNAPIASSHDPRLSSSCSLFRLCHCPICRIPPPSRP